MKPFFKYLLIGTISANVPFVVFGLMFGWPAVLLTAALMAHREEWLQKQNSFDAACAGLAYGLVSTSLLNIALNVGTGEPIGFAFTACAVPSIVTSAVLVGIFHRIKKV